MQRHQRRSQAADIGLPIDADVEQPGMEAHGDREAGENEAGGVIEREADALEIAERSADQQLDRLPRAFADHGNDQAGDQERGGDVEQRDEPDVGPAGEGF